MYIFPYYRNGNTNIKKISTKVVVINLRETRLTMTKYNLDRSN